MIEYSTASQTGRLHRENQDRVVADAVRGIFLVVDGIGGLADAAATAKLVAAELRDLVHVHVPMLAEPGVADVVTGLVAELNERVRAAARSGPDTTGAAFALLVIRDGLALAVHLGDSRIYRARRGRFARLTEDHVLDGRLTRFVGMPGEVVPGISLHVLEPGDRFLLCTDGLVANVDEGLLGDALSTWTEVDVVCEGLVGHAGEAVDDVSAVTLQYGGQP
ncbi:MAG: phosphoprotein phosphatase [Amycolatopsis sp.]|uniref:PP2C family protein-serine/threonine phosphatase n=1 Tax=Amycolatopsis sp. TaxID=37632 RepID=UPI0026254B35|nr:protein phosphatase 2C domain-containing protein [Amycolatopsis sp.]MCU1685292.1 phosphoprotein phosphatase [Amycolatopsis sp.]